MLPSELSTAAVQGDGGLGGRRELLSLELKAGVQDCRLIWSCTPLVAGCFLLTWEEIL